MNGADIGMIEGRDGVNLAVETLNKLLVHGFDGDIAPHARVRSAVNLPHAASADARQNSVGAESLSWSKH